MDTSASSRGLVRIQAQTGLVVAGYLALHLTNTLFALGGEGAYDGFQHVVRYAYQNPITETLLIVSILVHIGVGIARWRRRHGGEKVAWRIRLHRYAAYFLMVMIFGHVAATRVPYALYGIHVGFRALSYSLSSVPAYFYPYYALLAVSGLYHGLHGTYVALSVLGVRVPSVLRKGPGFNVPLVLFGVGLVLSLFAIGGWFFPIHDPLDNGFARLGERLMGR